MKVEAKPSSAGYYSGPNKKSPINKVNPRTARPPGRQAGTAHPLGEY